MHACVLHACDAATCGAFANTLRGWVRAGRCRMATRSPARWVCVGGAVDDAHSGGAWPKPAGLHARMAACLRAGPSHVVIARGTRVPPCPCACTQCMQVTKGLEDAGAAKAECYRCAAQPLVDAWACGQCAALGSPQKRSACIDCLISGKPLDPCKSVG